MNRKMPLVSTIEFLRAIGFSIVLASSTMLSPLQASTWLGAGSGGSWSMPENWDAVPAGTVSLVFDGTTNLETSNDISGITAGSITFGAGAGAFILAGPEAVTLGGNITNSSGNEQTITLGLNLSASRTIGGGAGIVLGGAVTNTATTGRQDLTLTGSGRITGTLASSTGGTLGILVSPAADTATWSVLGNSTTTLDRGQFRLNQGTVNFGSVTDAPTLTISEYGTSTGEYFLVGGAANANSTFNMANGTINLTSTTSGRRFTTGNASNALGGKAVWNQTGGAVNLSLNTAGSYGIFLANTAGSITEFNVSGGTFNAGSAQVISATRGTNVMTISGTGQFRTTGVITTRNNADAINASSTINLEGGSLTAGQITKTTGTNANTSILNFDGGTLKPSANHASFITSLTAANVKAGGAIIDTDGFDITIPQALMHDAALGVVPDGGLTKIGAGTLALSGANTYTGNTTVAAGTLSLLNAFLDDDSNILLTSGALLSLDFLGSDTIGMFFLDGVAQSVGTWGGPASGAEFVSSFLAGTGILNVTAVPEPAHGAVGVAILLLAVLLMRRHRQSIGARA